MAEFVRVAAVSDLPPNKLLGVELDGHRVCLANADGRIYAFRDNCSHQDFPLSAGEMDDGTVECAWHGAKFDMESGRALSLPAIRPIETYPVKVEENDIFVELE